MALQWRTELSLCDAVTQRSGTELRLKAAELRGLSADTNINSGHYKDTGAAGPLVNVVYAAAEKQLSLSFHYVSV